MFVDIIENPPEAMWREALADPNATFFHTPDWSRLMEEGLPGKVSSCPAAFRLADGATAVLPLMRLARLGGLLRTLHAMFPGVYGGPVCKRPLTGEERLAINEWLAGREGIRTFVVTPPGVPNPVPWGAQKIGLFTQRLSLHPDLHFLESDLLSHGKKYSVKRAEREGAVVAVAGSAAEWREYYGAYEASLGRWRSRSAYRYPLRLFEAMAADRSGGVALWMVRVGGELAAGAVILSHGRHIVTWHEASFAQYHRLGVNDYLHVRIMEDAARRGLPYFDFNPSGGHRGVEEYKASFGAETVPLEAWIREPEWVRVAKRMKRMLR